LAIEASTRVAAEACGVAHLAGTVEAGKEADLLVVRGDPLADIRRMADVAAVYRGGLHVGPWPEGVIAPGRRPLAGLAARRRH
jgi:imidazolonepropionase-like amidohydrolase